LRYTGIFPSRSRISSAFGAGPGKGDPLRSDEGFDRLVAEAVSEAGADRKLDIQHQRRKLRTALTAKALDAGARATRAAIAARSAARRATVISSSRLVRMVTKALRRWAR
jgi:hypothetical protein